MTGGPLLDFVPAGPARVVEAGCAARVSDAQAAVADADVFQWLVEARAESPRAGPPNEGVPA